MWRTALIAFGLMLVFEGLLPLVFPRLWKDTWRKLAELESGQIRFLGLVSIVAGALILFSFAAF